jgi:histidine triad (HIT) family protein
MGYPTHAPPGYDCPFCRIVAGADLSGVETRPEDVVLRAPAATAFVASRWWPRNPGHVLVVPNAHHENLYGLPDEDGAAVHALVRRVAIALRASYGCQGTSTRQHNEPAGQQDVWHYHVHVFPRYPGDDLYLVPRPHTPAPPEERRRYAGILRAALA